MRFLTSLLKTDAAKGRTIKANSSAPQSDQVQVPQFVLQIDACLSVEEFNAVTSTNHICRTQVAQNMKFGDKTTVEAILTQHFIRVSVEFNPFDNRKPMTEKELLNLAERVQAQLGRNLLTLLSEG